MSISNPPAFPQIEAPVPGYPGWLEELEKGGMSIGDVFMAAAVIGILSHPRVKATTKPETIAKRAKSIARALLKERIK